jgi:hypothetical protein
VGYQVRKKEKKNDLNFEIGREKQGKEVGG